MREPVIATKIEGSAMDSSVAGGFQLEADGKGLFYVCPCGCGDLGFLGFRGRSDPARPSWEWDGNGDKPTLAPSIRRTAGCKFHGHLRAGVWTFEGDSGQ